MGQRKCLFTENQAEMETQYFTESRMSFMFFMCEFCGWYVVSRDLFRILEEKVIPFSDQGRVNCAHQCLTNKKENPNNKKIPFFVLSSSKDSISNMLKETKKDSGFSVCVFENIINATIDHSEKPYVLLGRIASQLAQQEAFNTYKITAEDIIFSRISNLDELSTVANYLIDNKLIKTTKSTFDVKGNSYYVFDDKKEVILTVNGWAEVRKRNLAVNTNKVFIAIQFDWQEDEPLRQRVITSIQNACDKHGYKADLVTQHHTDNVTNQIIADIKKSRFLIAEFTHNNRGVYFEAGFARGLGIPTFHLVRKGYTNGVNSKGMKIHFDIQQIKYMEWETPEGLEKDLYEWIGATVGSYSSVKK